MHKNSLFFATLVLLGFALPAHAAPVELITNGDFETGTFAGWTVNAQAGSSGNWFIDTPGTSTPVMEAPIAPNASGGSFYALTDQELPGAYVLVQDFTVPFDATGVVLTFQMFANDWSDLGPSVNPAGLDYTAEPNQHVRVDILAADADNFDTGAGVVANFYLGVDEGGNPNPYTDYDFDLTALLTPGETYRLRFAEVDNFGPLTLGVDNVSIIADNAIVPVPEPAALGLLGVGLLAAAGLRRRKAA